MRGSPGTHKARWGAILATLGGLLVALVINHRSYLTDFNLVPGDLGDTRLLVYTLEHWYEVFRGREAFLSLNIFYPDPHALAYNDAWFLFAFPYAAARALGADYFTSYQLLLPLLTVIGYAAWIQVLRRLLHLEQGSAILGAILLTSLNSLQFLADYGKFAAIDLFPVLILLLLKFTQTGPRSSWKGALNLSGFAAGLGLLFFTSYHPPWFFVFALGVFSVLAVLVAAVTQGLRPVLTRMLKFASARRWDLVAGIAALLIALIPFARTYLPLVEQGSIRGFDLVLEFSPRLQDVVNVSALNLVWSPLLNALGFDFGNREVQMGSPLLVLLIAGLTTSFLLVRMRRTGWIGTEMKARVLLLMAATAAVLVLLSAKFGSFSAWYPVYRLVPGATAVRALGRILVIVDMIVIVIALHGLQELHRRLVAGRREHAAWSSAGFAALAIVLVAEQVNGMTFRLGKSDQLAFMERYPAQQEPCAAFFINNAQSDDLPFGYYHLDAMMIGMHLGLPTVNGYSGFEPHEAFTLVPRGDEYTYRVLEWLEQEAALSGICELDYSSAVFRPVDVEAELPLAQEAFRLEQLRMFTSLFTAAREFVLDGNDLKDLFPEYLESHGYLDPAMGHEEGPRYRWIQGRYWIGPRRCGNSMCIGIAIVGRYSDLAPIFDRYADRSTLITFPQDGEVWEGSVADPDTRGEALFTFHIEQLVP